MRKIKLKSKAHVETMRKSGKAASIMLQRIGEAIEPNISTYQLDQICRKTIKELGGESSFLDYKLPNHPPYPATICASINEEIESIHSLLLSAKNPLILSSTILLLIPIGEATTGIPVAMY